MTKKILATCGFKTSLRCYLIREVALTQFYRNRKKNGGKFKCKMCASFEKLTFARKLSKNDNFFSDVDSEIKAYMLGVFAGDGNIKNNTVRIVSHSDDVETLELFKQYISPKSTIKTYKNQKCSYISFSSAQIVKDICNALKILPGKKSDVITLPDLDRDLTWHFIRGLIDTDGSISNLMTSKRTFPVCSYASKSTTIKNQIKNLCDINGINHTEDALSVVFNGTNAIKFMNKIYENCTVKLSRKYRLYEIALEWIPGKGIPGRPRKIRKDKGTKHVRT